MNLCNTVLTTVKSFVKTEWQSLLLIHISCRIKICNSADILCNILQEGQHPMTGQHVANFRLLANQWAESRLVTQWRHGCRAMSRSVRNAGASNAGQSLCIQISREWSYPLPIYSYDSKGNWLCYNFAAESFYIMKLCSRLFVLYCRNCPKDDKFRYFISILRKLGAA